MGLKELMGDRQANSETKNDSAREVNSKLEEAVRLMYENEEISQNVSKELPSQTLKLISSKEKIAVIQHNLSKSEKTIRSIMRRIGKISLW
jgi:septal ring factor EnvC (AmiA/AmiB activator)